MEMYNFLIYDFDGTLSDTYPIFTEAFLKLMEKYNTSFGTQIEKLG